MKKKARIGLLVLAVIFILGFIYFATSKRDKKEELVYTPGPYSDEQLDLISQKSFSQKQTMDDLENICDVQYVEKDSPEKLAVVTGDSQVLVIHYDEYGNMQSQKMCAISPSSEEFEALSAEDSVNSVMNIDPQADYGFLFTGRNDAPKLSYHITEDGYCIEVSYDSNNNITDIVKSPLEN